MKIFIAYFTWDERIGKLAQEIAARTGGRLFEIRPIEDYPKDKLQLCQRVSQELFEGTLPGYLEDADIESYDIIFLGFPIWAHRIPPVMQTFIKRHDFTNKTVVPFCSCFTGLDASKIQDLANDIKGALVRQGFALTQEIAGFDRWLEMTMDEINHHQIK